ncbi:MAG TPA: polysaccharide biosynthesis protein [Arcobacter sp.]|nr:polysaccharide biosynthesis protein [Arcobacter sp.]
MLIKPSPLKRAFFFVILDIYISFLTLVLAYNLRFDFGFESTQFKNFLTIFVVLTLLKIGAFALFRLYNISWRFFSLHDFKSLVYAHFLAYIGIVIFYYINTNLFVPFPRSIIAIDLFLSIFFIGMFRISKRVILESTNNESSKKIVIFGVNEYTKQYIKKNNSSQIDYIFENDQEFIGSYAFDKKVLSLEKLERYIQKQEISQVILTNKINQKELNQLTKLFHSYDIYNIKLVELDKNGILKDIAVEDLLARYPKDLDKIAIKRFISNKKVLITGAGGSIGSEISKQCAIYGASEITLLDHSEFNLYQIAETLQEYKPNLVMQSVVDLESLDTTFKKYKPDIVIHAAAYKHVPLVESNIKEAIKNNILGTKNIIDCAIKHEAEKFVLISSDKAVRPTNVMGATKRVCELYAGNVDNKKTKIVSVRFGNVLGSSGSVIPKFIKQIKNGGPVTVTHPEINRYFMLIPEACELVLQAASLNREKEVFILDMGEPVKIVDLANKLIELLGKKDEVEIEFTGLRPGEKLYEELLLNESDEKTKYESIQVAKNTFYQIEQLEHDIDRLQSKDDTLTLLKQIVPEFEHKPHNEGK